MSTIRSRIPSAPAPKTSAAPSARSAAGASKSSASAVRGGRDAFVATTAKAQAVMKTSTRPAAGGDPVDALPMSAEDKQTVKDARDGKYGPEVAAQTQRTLEAVSRLPPESQARALSLVASSPRSTSATLAAEIVTSPGFQSLPGDQQAKLCEVVGAAGFTGLSALAELSQDPARLADKDKDGLTLLDNLAKLATQPVNADLLAATPGARQQILDGVLLEVSNPGKYVKQGGFNTCQVTATQYALVKANPAEYARLMAGLAGPGGQAVMRGGETLELQKEHLDLQGDWRSLSCSIFQGAAMEYSNGIADYDAATDTQHLGPFSATGLPLFLENRLPSQLFGEGYTQSVPLLGNADAQLGFLAQYDTSTHGAPVLLDLALPGMDLLHIVTFDHVEDGRVYFRNPWGPSGDPQGTEGASGRLEDPATGLYSMSVEDFQKILKGTHLPSAALAEYQEQQRAAGPQPQPVPTPPAPPQATPSPTQAVDVKAERLRHLVG
ncbi:MAG: hypothetical protein ACYC8T_22810 [Myxococcaceae bacterium]